MSTKEKASKPDKAASQKQAAPARSIAEWAAFGISLLIVTGMIGLILFLHFRQSQHGAVIVVRPRLEMVRLEGSQYYLPVEVENTGGETAESVWVEVTLQPADGEPETGQFTILFLAGSEIGHGVVTFGQDPKQGEIRSKISYIRP